MKKLVTAAVVSILFSTAAYAGTISFPSDDPVATITIPDSWKPSETDTGVDAVSPDNAIYISVDVAAADETEKVVRDAAEYLQKKGVTVDKSTAKQTTDTLNGMPLAIYDMDGKDEDGPVSVSIAAAGVSDKTNLVITYWGAKGDEDKDQQQFVDILHSLKPAAK
jgi:hypothetical protein